MKSNLKPIILVFLFFFFSLLSAQNARIDSLESQLDHVTGKKRINILTTLGEEYLKSDLEKAKAISREALEASQHEEFTLGIMNACNNLGLVGFYQNDLETAEDNFLISLSAAEELNKEKAIARLYNNLGLIRWRYGDYIAALDYYEHSIKAKEKLGDKEGILNTSINQGLIAIDMGNYHKANRIFSEALLLV